jgi:hypothetical protein
VIEITIADDDLAQLQLVRREAGHSGDRQHRSCFARDHVYKRHGTLSVLAGIDLRTGTVHASVEDRHRTREFVGFLKKLDAAYPTDTAIKVILDNHSAHVSKETKAWLATQGEGRFTFVFTPKRGSISWKASSPSWRGPCSAASASHPRPNSNRGSSRTSLTSTRNPSFHTWTYKIDEAA